MPHGLPVILWHLTPGLLASLQLCLLSPCLSAWISHLVIFWRSSLLANGNKTYSQHTEGHPLFVRVVCMPSETQVEKPTFSFVGEHQWRELWVRMQACVHFPLLLQDLCEPSTCCRSSCELCVCQLLCLEGLVFLGFFLALTIIPPFLQGSLSPEEREKLETSHLELSAPRCHSLQGPVWVCLTIRSHLEQEEPSLMMAKWDTDLWI